MAAEHWDCRQTVSTIWRFGQVEQWLNFEENCLTHQEPIMIAAALALLAFGAALVAQIGMRSRAERPETGIFAGLAADIERLSQDEAACVTTDEDEWEPMRMAA